MSDAIKSLDADIALLDARIAQLRRHLPPVYDSLEAKPKRSPFTHCPVCGGEVQPGNVSVHETVWSFLLVGLSYQHCWFQGDEEEKQVVVIPSACARRGCRCPRCGFVGIEGGENEPARRGIGDV